MYIYVMGRGHSGSTILDILMGGGAAAESVGELCILGARGLPGSPSEVVDDPGKKAAAVCSCGAPIAACPFWTAVRERFAASGLEWQPSVRALFDHANVRNFWGTLVASRDPAKAPRRLAELARIVPALEAAITGAAGKPHLFNSNKEPTRALFLLKYHPGARVIHLVRDPRGIVQSHYWRIRGAHGFRFLRRHYEVGRWAAPFVLLLAAGSWVVGNLCAELAVRAAPERVLRLRYEDLRDDPAGAIRAIGAAFGLPVDDVLGRLERGEPFPVGHNVGGNHIRREREVRFDPGTERKRPPLPAWADLATTLVCWPLMRRYGYPLRRPATLSPPPSAGRPAKAA